VDIILFILIIIMIMSREIITSMRIIMTINITRIKFFIRIIRQRLNQLSHNAVRNSIVTKSIPDPVAIAVAPFVSLVGTLAAGAGEVSSAVHGGGGQHAPVSEPVAIAAAPVGALSLGTPGAGAGEVSSAVHGVDEKNAPVSDPVAIAAAPDGAFSLGTLGAGAGDVSSAVHGVDEIWRSVGRE